MNRSCCLTSVIALFMLIMLFGCEGKVEKKAAESSDEAEKMSQETKMASEKMAMPFGGEGDTEFADMVWAAMKGYENWVMKTDMQPGKSPHGKFVRIYYSVVNVAEKPYHTIIKDNFTPDKELAAVTIMLQREAGYDQDNNNWFWVKYNADGTVSKNDKEMALAGRVAKGMDTGCIACHKSAKDNDYVFTNDGEM